MTTKSLGSSFKISGGKVVKRPPRMPAGQKKNKALKASRLAKQWAERSK
jgi:ribosomal protein S30